MSIKNHKSHGVCLLSSLAAGAAFLVMTAFAFEAKADKLFFASDLHGPLDNLTNLLRPACGDGSCNVVGLVGDYADYSVDAFPSDPARIGKVMNLVHDINGPDYVGDAVQVFTRGNHETNIGSMCPWLRATGSIGQFEVGAYYDMFVINPNEFGNAPALLREVPGICGANDKVLFVLSHLPLHSKRTDPDSLAVANQQNLFNFLQDCSAKNEDGSKRREIVFLWGHNHSKPSDSAIAEWDAGVDYVVTPGEVVGSGPGVRDGMGTVPFNFFYLNAGYLSPRSDVVNNVPSAVVVDVTQSLISIDRRGASAATVNWSR